jgi:hypothetical protein
MRQNLEVIPAQSLTRAQFDRELERLIHLKDQVARVLRPAVEAYLAFAREYWTVYQSVESDPARLAVLRRRLGITEDYQHQRLRRIAEQSQVLHPYRYALPAAVEPLYEAALVAAKYPKRLKEVTADSGIREIRELKKPKSARRAHDAERPSTAVVVTLTVSDYGEKHIAEALAVLLESDAHAQIRSDSRSVVAATKAALVARYELLARERGDPVPHEPDVSWNPVLAHDQLQRGTKPGGTKGDDVTRNEKHPYHTAEVPNLVQAARLIRDAESMKWLVPELGLTYEHYVPELKKRQERITKR